MLSWFVALGIPGLGQYMQASRWGFAVVEAVHLLGFAILGGAVLIVDLRLLGLVLKGESARNVSRDLSKLLLGSLVLMLVTGMAIVSEEALNVTAARRSAGRWRYLQQPSCSTSRSIALRCFGWKGMMPMYGLA